VRESLRLTRAGGSFRVGGAKLLFDALALRRISQFVPADMRMRPETLLFFGALTLVMALAAAGWPAYRAARLRIAEALRYTG